MSLIYFTRRLHSGGIHARNGIRCAVWALAGAALSGSAVLEHALADLHAKALRRVRNKARFKHIQLAKDYSRLQDRHANVEKQLASVRLAAMTELLRVGDQTLAIEEGVHIELKQLGKND